MLVRGDKLSPEVRREVLSAYGYRWTVENQQRARQWLGNALEAVVPVTDAEWLRTHAFYVVKDGTRLARNRHHCEPYYLADDHS